MLLISFLGFWVTLVWYVRGLGRGAEPLLVYFVATAVLFYGLRATIFVAGLDHPEPALFFNTDLHSLLARTLGWITAFLLVSALAYATWVRLTALRLPVYRKAEVDPGRMLVWTAVLTGFGTVITLLLVAHFGSPGNVIRAGKIGHGLTGLYALRTFAAVGSILAASTIVDGRRLGARPGTLICALIFLVLDSYYVYLWGTRTVAAISVAIVVIGWRRGERAQGQKRARVSRGRLVLRFVGVALLVTLLAVALRTTRADTLSPRGDVAAQNANRYGRVSLALDATYLDASMLAVQDQGRLYDYPRGADFVSGVDGLVPGFLWHGKSTETSGVRFRHLYQPTIVNGWPVGAPTAWYLNFGPLGLLLGGYLTGLVLAALANSRRESADSGFNLAVSLVTVALVLQLGVNPDSLQRAVLWWLPLVVIGRVIGHRQAGPVHGSVRPSHARQQVRA